MSRKILPVSLLLLLVCATSQVQAGRIWITNPIELNVGGGMTETINASRCALAMRSQGTWPVVAYAGGTDRGIAMMTPVGYVPVYQPGSGWAGSIDAAVSSTGLVGFACASGQYAQLGPSGLGTVGYSGQTSLDSRPGLAYRADALPSVAHDGASANVSVSMYNGMSWVQDIPNDQGSTFSGHLFALEYDSLGNTNLVFSDGATTTSAFKQAGQWYFTDIGLNSTDDLDLALAYGDVPWLAYKDGTDLYYTTYDRQSNTWTAGDYLDALSPTGTGHFSVASDAFGGVGFAYVDDLGMLTYKYWDRTEGWQSDSLITQANGSGDVSLAFDADNNPVICYQDTGGLLSLAYDPVIPEPASLALIGLGALLLRRRR